MTKPRLLYAQVFATFVLIILGSQDPESYPYHDRLQDSSAKYAYHVKDSLFINIEELLGQNIPYQVRKYQPESCKLQPASLNLLEKVPFGGSFLRGEKPFFISNNYYAIKIDPKSLQVFLITFRYKSLGDSSGFSFTQHEQKLHVKITDPNSDLLDLIIYKHIAILSTKVDLLIFSFTDPKNPVLIGVFAVSTTSIECLNVKGDSDLYIAGPNRLIVYSISGIEKKVIKVRVTFTEYKLPNSQVQKINSIRSISVCSDIIFLLEKDQLLIFKETPTLFITTKLEISKVVSLSNEGISTVRVGRSLIVLTSKELIEYVFVNDCMDIRENIRVPNTLFGFDVDIQAVNRKAFVELKAGNNNTYFTILNKINNHVYVFQSTGLKTSQTNEQPYIYSYKRDSQSIESIDLYESFHDYSENGLTLIVKQEPDQVHAIILQREPLGFDCKAWIAKTEKVSIHLTSRFCHPVVYDYNAYIQENKGRIEYNAYTDKFYFNPADICKRSLEFDITYEWSSSLLIVIILTLIAGLLAVLFIRRHYRRKRSGGSQYKHRRLQKKVDSAENSREEVSSVSSSNIEKAENDSSIDRNDADQSKSLHKRKTNL